MKKRCLTIFALLLLLLCACASQPATECTTQEAAAEPPERVEALPPTYRAEEIVSCLQQALMQVYTGQPVLPDDVFAAAAQYLQAQPALCEAYLPFDDLGVSVYALDEAGGYQLVLFHQSVFQAAYLQYRPEQGVCEVVCDTSAADVDCAPEIQTLIESAQMGASYEYIYYDLCPVDTEKAAFEAYLRAAKNAFKAWLSENWAAYAAEQSEMLRAMLSLAVDYSVNFELYDGNICMATLHFLPGMGSFTTEKRSALVSFMAAEQLPALPEAQNSTKTGETLLLLDESTVAIPATRRSEESEQNYLFVYHLARDDS